MEIPTEKDQKITEDKLKDIIISLEVEKMQNLPKDWKAVPKPELGKLICFHDNLLVESKMINNDFSPIQKDDIVNLFCTRCLEKFTMKLI